MKLYMTEIVVRDLAASVAWYVSHGLRIEKDDAANGFVLLTDTADGRLALKAGTPNPGTVLLHFEVDTLTPGEVKDSDEGYRRVIVDDPDGYRICLFQFAVTLTLTRC
ncbi:hypothetical protein BH11PLA2_BH11PLA2_00690 [soil metagenome]